MIYTSDGVSCVHCGWSRQYDDDILEGSTLRAWDRFGAAWAAMFHAMLHALRWWEKQ